jgi:hypothetical protein
MHEKAAATGAGEHRFSHGRRHHARNCSISRISARGEDLSRRMNRVMTAPCHGCSARWCLASTSHHDLI